MTSRPFNEDDDPGLKSLRNWLAELPDQDAVIGGQYRVRDLVADLDRLLRQMWHDGIDARGEDA